MELPICILRDFNAGQHFCKISISVPEDCFYLSKHADPDEMQPYAAFHLGLHCLPKYKCTCLSVSKMKRVKVCIYITIHTFLEATKI